MNEIAETLGLVTQDGRVVGRHTMTPFESLARHRSVLVAIAHPQDSDDLTKTLEACTEAS